MNIIPGTGCKTLKAKTYAQLGTGSSRTLDERMLEPKVCKAKPATQFPLFREHVTVEVIRFISNMASVRAIYRNVKRERYKMTCKYKLQKITKSKNIK